MMLKKITVMLLTIIVLAVFLPVNLLYDYLMGILLSVENPILDMLKDDFYGNEPNPLEIRKI